MKKMSGVITFWRKLLQQDFDFLFSSSIKGTTIISYLKSEANRWFHSMKQGNDKESEFYL